MDKRPQMTPTPSVERDCAKAAQAGYFYVGQTKEFIVPTISMFYGILILMYFYDNKKHSCPHIHAEYGEYEATIAIDDGSILGGSLPSAKMKLVQAWIEIHREDLLADWKLAVSGEPVFKIDPLR